MEEKLKYLEFVQNNISRMNQNSLQMKMLCITIVSALLAVFASTANGETYNKAFVAIAFIPTVIFWFLDSYYLRLERQFRELYKNIINDKDGTIKLFDMNISEFNENGCCKISCLFSHTESMFYISILVVLCIVMVSI